MGPLMLEVVCRAPGGGRVSVMPLVGELLIGADANCDWPIAADACGGASVTLAPLGEHVRIDPMGQSLRLHGHRPLREPRLLRLPVRFVLGTTEFEVRIVGSAADGVLRPVPHFDGLVAAESGALANGDGVHAVAADGSPRNVRPQRDRWMLGGVALLVTVGVCGLVLAASVFSRKADARPLLASPVAAATTARTGPGTLADGYPERARFDANEHLRRRAEAILRGAEIEPGVVFRMDATGPVLTGEASPQDIERLTRIFVRAARAEPELAALRFAMSPRAETDALPFRIEQVVGGAAPHLILDDGSMLEPGQRREGIALVSIQGHRIVLQGARRIEVDW